MEKAEKELMFEADFSSYFVWSNLRVTESPGYNSNFLL